jgi:hypothetical protein
MPEKYKEIQGWFDFPDIYLAAADGLKDGDIAVEIGAWRGASTCFLAERLKELGKSVVFYVVDTWRGSPDEPDQMGAIAESSVSLYEQFYGNMERAGVIDSILPLRMDSEMASRIATDSSVQFLFLDGDHSAAAVRQDLEAWFPKMRVGSVMSGHDYWQDQVRLQVDAFFAAKGLPVERNGQCWWVRVTAR